MQALLYHKESMTVGKESAFKTCYMSRNRILFTCKHPPSFAFLMFVLYFTALVIPKTVIGYAKKGRRDLIPVFFKAIRWNLKNGINSNEAALPLN
jgi:GT2 family glycosyltransferase